MEEVKRVSKLELENKVLRAEHEELSTAHKNLKEEMKEQREMDTLKQQTDKKETNDKIDSLKKEQFANIRGMEQKQKDGQEELQRKIDESLKSVQVMVVAELEKYQNKQQQNIDALTEKLKGSIDQFSLKYQELSNVHKKLMEEMKEQREMDALKQQKDQKETNDKIDSLKKDQEQSANNIRGMEQKQKDGQKELQRNIQAMVDAKLEEQKVSNANKFAEIEQKNDKLEKYQKEQSPNIVDLQKTIATLKEIGQQCE
uniref:Viral A-type inclusion protein n=1 Tax=Globodera pallida TaxID=36090 RepID=A0A183CQA3_GLOPA